jgi:hypothetical protein
MKRQDRQPAYQYIVVLCTIVLAEYTLLGTIVFLSECSTVMLDVQP